MASAAAEQRPAGLSRPVRLSRGRAPGRSAPSPSAPRQGELTPLSHLWTRRFVVDPAGAWRYPYAVQIYLLSVLSTIAAGTTLAADYLVDRVPVLEPLRRFAASNRAKSTLGAIAVVVGFVKLFARAPVANPEAKQWFIVGDFLPAVAGMLLGAMLMIDRCRERKLPGDGAEQVVAGDGADEGAATNESSDAGHTAISKIDDALKPYRTPLGLAGIAVGVIHFLLARLQFL